MRSVVIALPLVLLLVAAPSRASEPTAEPPGEPVDDGLVPVVFEPSQPHVVLERRAELRTGVDSEGATAICVTGCRTRLDPHATYQIGGTWVTPQPFRLPAGARGPLRITAAPGSSRTEQLGVGLALGGGMMLGLGGVTTGALLGLGATKNEPAGAPANVALVSAISVAAAGLVMLLVSLPLRGEVTRVDVRELR